MSDYEMNELKLRRSYTKFVMIFVIICSMVVFRLAIEWGKSNRATTAVEQWLEALKAEAVSLGVTKIIVDQALDGIIPYPELLN